MDLTREQILAAIANTEKSIAGFQTSAESPIRSVRRSGRDAIMVLTQHVESLKQRLAALEAR